MAGLFDKMKKDAPVEDASAMAMGGESSEPGPVDAMQTFIDAVKAGDASAAHSAMESYKELCSYDSEPEEMPMMPSKKVSG